MANCKCERFGAKTGIQAGYAVAVLAGIEENQAILWRVFSNVVKPEKP